MCIPPQALSVLILMLGFLNSFTRILHAAGSLWLEVEHFEGIRGYCWPMGVDKRKLRETDGHWGLSGPGGR